MNLTDATDEMIDAARKAHGSGDSWRSVVEAVIAVIERDHTIGLAMCGQPHPTEAGAYCELRRGHGERSGRGHSATVTKAVDW